MSNKTTWEEVATPEVMEAMDVVPVFARVIVKELQLDETRGGLYVPDTAKKTEMQTNEGYIIAIGGIVEKEGMFKVGDRVYYGRHSGMYFTRNGIEFRVMQDEDIVGHVRRA